MRKLSKILAVILTVGILAGIIAVTASADTSRTDNLIPVVNGDYLEHFSKSSTSFEDDTVGDITSYSGWSGQQGGADKTTLDWYIGGEAGADGYVNKYMNFLHYVNDTKPTSTSTIQPFVKTGEWSTTDDQVRDRDFTNAYDYLVIDFEYGTDRYKYFDGESYTTYTPEMLEEAGLAPDSPGVTLAMQGGQSIYPQLRGLKDSVNGTWSSSGISWSPSLSVAEIDGEFYLKSDKTGKSVKLTNTVSEFDHVTIVVRVTSRYAVGDITVCDYSTDFFVNGVYLGSDTRQGNHSTSPWQTLSADFVCFSTPKEIRNQDAYSLCLDNMTTNYYKIGYDSGDAYGLDDYYKAFNASSPADFTELDDVVYNYDYKTHNYIELDGVKYYNRTDAIALISELEGYKTITSTMALKNLVVSDGLDTLTVKTDKEVTIANDGGRNLIVAKIDGGYEIREATEDDYYKINWYDANVDLIATTEHIFGNDVSPFTVSPNYADAVEGKIYNYTSPEWYVDISGDLEAMRPVDFGEIEAGTAIDAYIVSDPEAVDVSFFVGVYDEETKKVKLSVDPEGGYMLYLNDANFKTCVQNAADDATLVLCSDVNIVGVSSIAIGAGKTFSLDLNGHDLLRVGGAVANTSQPSACFVLNEGSAFNLYSSREGGRIFDAAPYTAKKTATLDGVSTSVITEDISYSSGGFIINNSGVDECTANVGAFRGYAANLEYNGGSLFYGQGKNYRDNGGDWNELVNDKKVTFNINGGNYYVPARPAYALATTTGPDVVWNFENANFYVSNTTYGLIHDYDDGRFSINTTATIKNCNILSYNADNIGRPYYTVSNGAATLAGSPQGGAVGDYCKVFYTVGAKSKMYIEGCNIIGKLYQGINTGGEIILGGGNVINTNSNLKSSAIKVADGAMIVFPTSNDKSFEFTVSVSHPNFYADYEQYLVKGETNWAIKEGAFDGEDVVASATKYATAITVSNSIPAVAADYVVPIKWYDPDGAIYATTYAFKNDTITKIAGGNFAVTELDNGWFDVGYGDWTNITEDAANGDSLIASAEKENKFVPKKSLIADIDGGQAKLDVYQREFTFYYYFPKPNADLIEYSHGGDATLGTGWYSNHNPTASTAPYTVSTYLKSTDTHYYNYFYVGASTMGNYNRAIRFLVKEYDLNGDSFITEDEKNIPLVQNLVLSVPRYCELLVNYYDHGSDESNLAYEIMRYMKETSLYISSTADVSPLDSFFAAYDAKCDCTGADGEKVCSHVRDLDTLVPDAGRYDVSDLNGYLHSAAFGLGVDKPDFDLYLLPIDGTYSVSVKYAKYVVSDGKVTMSDFSANVTNKGAKTLTLPGGSTVDVIIYRVTGIPASYVHRDLEISITANYTDEAKEDVTVTGVYSMAAYINNNPDVRVAKAMYALCEAALDYKLITSDEKK